MISSLLAVRLCGSLALAQSMDFSQDPKNPPPPAAAPVPAASPSQEKNADTVTGLQSEGVRKARFNEIERGFSLRLPVGMLAYLTPVKGQAPAGQKNFGPGMLMGMELGYDILPILDIAGFFYFAQSPGTLSGDIRDLTTLFGGLMARVSFFHTERVYVGVRGGAGYGVQDNLIEKKNTGVAIVAALTVEYFTRLRHVSLALDVGTVIWTTPIAVGLTVVPAIRWTL
jgi:hypothetical protein